MPLLMYFCQWPQKKKKQKKEKNQMAENNSTH